MTPNRTPTNWDELLRSCIHCGLCLNACPTHRLTGDEVESPRGRLLLMRDLLEGSPEWSIHDRPSLDRCLGCLACASACPSGVEYGRLLGESRRRLGPAKPLTAFLVDQVLTRPGLLRWIAQWTDRIRDWPLPAGLGEWIEAMPRRRPRRRVRKPRASSSTRGEVAILRGCAQWVFEPDVLDATVALIEAAGYTASIPEGQGCCGALSHHEGSVERARQLARQNLKAFARADHVVVPSAGCSAFLRELDELWPESSPLRGQAEQLAAKSEDFLPWLWRESGQVEFDACDERVVYQNPCHHQHAQGLIDEGRRLLARVPGLVVLEDHGAGLCCGSAGSYQLREPEMAKAQRAAKLEHLLADTPDRILTANPGCEFFLEAGLDSGPPVSHLVVFLADQLSG